MLNGGDANMCVKSGLNAQSLKMTPMRDSLLEEDCIYIYIYIYTRSVSGAVQVLKRFRRFRRPPAAAAHWALVASHRAPSHAGRTSIGGRNLENC